LILKYFPTLFPLPLLISGLDRAQTVHLFAHCTMTVRIRSPVAGAISLARRLSFSKASRFICNFIWEYFLKTCASPWRSICVTHSSATPPSTQPRGICGAKVVDAEVWNLCAPKSLQASD